MLEAYDTGITFANSGRYDRYRFKAWETGNKLDVWAAVAKRRFYPISMAAENYHKLEMVLGFSLLLLLAAGAASAVTQYDISRSVLAVRGHESSAADYMP